MSALGTVIYEPARSLDVFWLYVGGWLSFAAVVVMAGGWRSGV